MREAKSKAQPKSLGTLFLVYLILHSATSQSAECLHLTLGKCAKLAGKRGVIQFANTDLYLIFKKGKNSLKPQNIDYEFGVARKIL